MNNISLDAGVEVVLAESIGKVIFTFHNDDYINKAPTVFNEHLIPPEARRAMSKGWDSSSIPGRDIRIIILNDVIVGEQGLVLDSNFRVIKETITQHSNYEIDNFIKIARITSHIEDVNGKFLNLRKRGEQNYGHWLIECLPKLDYLGHLGSDYGVLVPNIGPQMNNVIDSSIKASGVSQDLTIVKMDKKEIKRFSTLAIIDGLTHHSSYMAPQVVHFNEKLSTCIEGSGMKKVFLLRDSQSRRIGNVDQLSSALEKLGFITISPGRLDFAGQISALKNADSIIGVMGAEMTNIVYANRGAKVLNITPASMPDTFFHFLSIHKGHSYIEFRCETDGPVQNRVGSMMVDVEKVCDIVNDYSF